LPYGKILCRFLKYFELEGKIRITDIAAMAGVSPGTVDRVLHNRGRVSEKSRKKVLEILAETHYQPNLIARTLSASRTRNIAVVMPDPSMDPFWETAQKGVAEGEKAFAPFGLKINAFYFNPERIKSFLFAGRKCMESRPDGILIAPFFQKESSAFIRRAEKAGIPVVTFNARPADIKTCSFIGQNLYQTGRLSAHLMTIAVQPPAKILILHIEEDFQNSVHLKEKERGFMDYLREKCDKKFDVSRLEFTGNKTIERKLLQTLKQYSGVRGLYVTTSKAFKIAEILKNNNLHGMTLVGYDLLEKNLQYMENGVIRFLINQHPGLQTFLGLSYFTDLLIFRKDIPEQKLLPVDIVTAENMDDYTTGLNLTKCL
jgi:LacI family transcriptional regulator